MAPIRGSRRRLVWGLVCLLALALTAPPTFAQQAPPIPEPDPAPAPAPPAPAPPPVLAPEPTFETDTTTAEPSSSASEPSSRPSSKKKAAKPKKEARPEKGRARPAPKRRAHAGAAQRDPGDPTPVIASQRTSVQVPVATRPPGPEVAPLARGFVFGLIGTAALFLAAAALPGRVLAGFSARLVARRSHLVLAASCALAAGLLAAMAAGI